MKEISRFQMKAQASLLFLRGGADFNDNDEVRIVIPFFTDQKTIPIINELRA